MVVAAVLPFGRSVPYLVGSRLRSLPSLLLITGTNSPIWLSTSPPEWSLDVCSVQGGGVAFWYMISVMVILCYFYQRATLINKSLIGPISEDRVSNEMSICRIYQIRPPHLSNTTTETDMNVQKHDAEVAWPAIFSAFQNVQKDVYEVAWPQNLMSFQISISLPVSFGSQKPTRSQIRSLSITFSWPFLHADL